VEAIFYRSVGVWSVFGRLSRVLRANLIEKYGKSSKKILLNKGMTIIIISLVVKINGCQT